MTARLILLLLLLAGAPVVLCACGPGSTSADAAATANTARYVVRGMVTALPDPSNPASDFMVHHEPIPAFKGNLNETTPVGMNSMIMPFPLASEITTEGLAVGDVVEITFVVRYSPETGDLVGYETTLITPLPAGTELQFGRTGNDAR